MPKKKWTPEVVEGGKSKKAPAKPKQKPTKGRKKAPAALPVPPPPPAAPPSKRGPPFVEIDPEQVRALAAIGCTDDDIATVLGIDRSTFYRRRQSGPDAEELRNALETGRANGRTSLRKKQFELATKGNVTMLIWLGKQMLGQRDKVAAEVGAPGSIDEQERAKGERELLAMLERAAARGGGGKG